MSVLVADAPRVALPEGAEQIINRQRARESSARTYARSFPIVPVKANGAWIEGADGRRYLDCLAGAGTLALGHNHPVVVDAIQGVLGRGSALHVLDLATPEKDHFLDVLFATLPAEFARNARVHFCGPTGADAVEAALKLAQTATGRRGLLAFTGAYHGMTAGALAVTGNVSVRDPVAALAAEVTRLPFPYPYRCPFGLGGAQTAEVGADYVERLLADPNGGVLPPAAMIAEVVQGEGGVVAAPDDWLRRIRLITARLDIPLIVDEVQTGVGRTGEFWATQQSGITPDAIVMSKAIGGGLPLAVVAYRDDLDVWAPGAHTGTFRGNTLAMAAGAATLRFVAAEGLDQRAARLGGSMLAVLRSMQADRPSIGEVRGRGLMIGVELVEPDAAPDQCGARPRAPALARAVRSECLRRGLIVELGGRDDCVVRLLPPLTLTDDEAATVLETLGAAIGAAEREFGGREPGLPG